MTFYLLLLDGDHSAGSQEQSYVGKRSNRVVRTLQNSKCGRLLDETARCLGQRGPEGLAFVSACPPPPQPSGPASYLPLTSYLVF